MESKLSLIEPLLERAEQYSKTSFELLKLKSLDKTADVTSNLISRLLFAIVLSIFVVLINIGIAIWLGDILGKNYYGFLIVGSFYGLISMVLFFIHPMIKARLNNSIITQLLK